MHKGELGGPVDTRLCFQAVPAVAQVISAKNDKTIIINFDSFKEHPLYRKRVRKTSRIVAHDEDGKAGLGDVVRIVPCAPVSKTKRFRLDAIVKKFGFLVDEVSSSNNIPSHRCC